jgi:hypothetical protein
MQSITLQTHVGTDGILKLETPLEQISNTDVKVRLVVTPLKKRRKLSTDSKEKHWPEGFFEQTFGSIPDFPLREPQGKYEVRDELE